MSKVVIIGGGFSGLVSAIYASKNNNITILERNEDILKKLLMTGNGRCNYFNENQNIDNYHSNNEELIKDIINENNINELLKFYQEIGIVPKIKNGYYYPFSNQALSVKNALVNKLKEANVNIITNYYVENIVKNNNKFIINNDIVCDKLIISTGSKAYPKTGSDGNGYDILKKFNLSMSNINPSLVSLVSDNKYLKELSGIRCDAKVSFYNNDKFIKSDIGELQLVDYGVSGICIFNLSYLFYKCNGKKTIKVNFIPFIDTKEELLKYLDDRNKIMNNNKKISELLNGIINTKLINVIIKNSNINNILYKSLDGEEKNRLCDSIFEFEFNILSTKSFDKAQVCSGGLLLSEININTMQTKKINNLYVIGELLDIDGICGGYNLTHSFISGYLAGKNI